MSDGIGTYLLGIACDGDGLEDALRAHRDGVTVVAQHITEDHILQRLLIILLCHVKGDISLCSELIGILLIFLELFLTESSCVGTSGIHVVTLFLQFHHCVRGVESS